MFSNQLKTLLWRNKVLKFRSWISTLLEIIIPSIIIIVLSSTSTTEKKEIKVPDLKNNTSSIIDNREDLPAFQKGRYHFGFVFPENYDQKQVFLENFQNNKIFQDFRVVGPNEDFSELTYNETQIQEVKSEIYDKYHDFDLYKYNNDYNPNTTYELKIDTFTSETEIMNLLKDQRTSYFYYGIVFQTPTDYTIYFDYYHDLKKDRMKTENHSYEKDFKMITIVQVLVDKAILQSLTNAYDTKEIEIQGRLMDQKGYTNTIYSNDAQMMVPLLYTFFFVPSICSFLNHLVMEKESKIRQSLVIVGLKKSTFWLAWLIIYGVMVVIIALISSFIMNATAFFIYIRMNVIIVSLILYGFSCLFLSIIFSALIRKVKTANVVGFFIAILFFALFILEMCIGKDSVLRWILIYTVAPFSFICFLNKLIEFDQQQLSVTFSTVWSDPTLRPLFLGLGVTLVGYALVAFYLDIVLGDGDHFYKKWYYCLPRFKSKTSNKPDLDSEKVKDQNPYIEKESPTSDKLVQVCGIRKSFKTSGQAKKAKDEVLKGITFNASTNEIFAILGHNGAGKTTLMNIMLGILKPSQGEVYYHDRSIAEDKFTICQEFGYCPQFDTFNPNLSVAEHIRLFAGIKGLKKVDVESVLKEIDLFSKMKNFPHELSGGQRRKLCIALAFLGSPKYVFLDEPTTGLDPYSRKTIWDYLMKKKEGRVIFFTTHYMDEADSLADRKMIIGEGKIECMGSSLFLKQSFNMNYTVDVQIRSREDISLLDTVIGNYIPESVNGRTLMDAFGQKLDNKPLNRIESKDIIDSLDPMEGPFTVTYLLSMKHAQYFQDLFKALNELVERPSTTIENFVVTAPTLEELFINLEKEEKEKQKGTEAQEHDMSKQDTQDFHKLLTKTLAPSQVIDIPSSNSAIDHELGFLIKKDPTVKASSLQQIRSLIKLRLKIFVRNKVFAFLYTLLPILVVVVCIYFVSRLLEKIGQVQTLESMELLPNLYGDSGKLWFKESHSNGGASSILDKIGQGKGACSVSLDSVDYDKELLFESGQLTEEFRFIGGFQGLDDSGSSPSPTTTLRFTLYRNDNYNFALPIAVNLLSNALLSSAQIEERISTKYAPFDYVSGISSMTTNDNEYINLFKEEISFLLNPLIMVFIGIVLSLSLSVYGPFMAKERESSLTHQMALHGMKPLNYWIGIVVSDTLCLLIPLLLIFVAGWISHLHIFTPTIVIYTFGITVLWIIVSLLHQYMISEFFRYERLSNLSTILNPILCLIMGIYIYIIVAFKSISPLLEMNHISADSSINLSNWAYLLVLLYCPALIIVIYSEIGYFSSLEIFGKSEAFKAQFMQRPEIVEIISKEGLTYLEKSTLITEKYVKAARPSLGDLFTGSHRQYIGYVGVLLLLGALYAFIIYWKERKRGQKKSSKGEKKKGKDELSSTITLSQDVLQEKKKVKQAMNSSFPSSTININIENVKEEDQEKTTGETETNLEDKETKETAIVPSTLPPPLLKVFEITKDYSMNAKEMAEKRKRDNQKFVNIFDKETFQEKGRTVFEYMDYRIVYDDTTQKYVQRIVEDVSFGVNRHECLGLLGPNGAGKTTTISIMTGNNTYDYGKVRYGEKDMGQAKLRDLSVGYCPQFDTLWELLTVEETIDFYLNVSGYPSQCISQYRKALLKACDITRHASKKVNEISGGTRRKLSLIVAIISSPDFLILDEPSAGTDPFTRRYLWKIISDLKELRETATVLTSHSMEEAEALSDRIAILLRGNLVCIDTPKNIKRRKGKDWYKLEVFVAPGHTLESFEAEYLEKRDVFGLTKDEAKEKLRKEESSPHHQRYSVQVPPSHISKVFAVMEEAKRQGWITEYNFGQYSLEQIYLNFINHVK